MSLKSNTSAGVRRILAIKPDPARAQVLRDLLGTSQGIRLEIVSNARAAIGSIAACPPDLIMVSTFLAPAEEAALRFYVRQLPDSRLPIIDIPYFIDDNDRSGRTRPARILRFLRGRSGLRPRCGANTLREQVELYLRRLGEPADLTDRLEAAGLDGSEKFRSARITAGGAAARASHAPEPAVESILRQRQDRRRARRKPPAELPWLWALKLPHSSAARVVDISSTGVLIETPTKILPGTMVDVELVGPELDLRMPARMLRAQVADVDPLGVKYRVAAAFARRLDLPGLDSGIGWSERPQSVGDLLKPLLSSVERAGGGVDAIVAFEAELRRLLPVRDIQIRQKPVIPEPGAESVYFTVPTGSSTPPILQVIFDRDQAPSDVEFKVLKAAAILAAAVLALAPASLDDGRLRQRLTA